MGCAKFRGTIHTPLEQRAQVACGVSPSRFCVNECLGWNTSSAVLPLQLLIEPSQCSVRIFHVFLCLLPHVEDRTILARTQHILEADTSPHINTGSSAKSSETSALQALTW